MRGEDRRDYGKLQELLQAEFVILRQERRNDIAALFKRVDADRQIFNDHLLAESLKREGDAVKVAAEKAEVTKLNGIRDLLINKHEEALKSVQYYGWRGVGVFLMLIGSYILHFMRKDVRDVIKDAFGWWFKF